MKKLVFIALAVLSMALGAMLSTVDVRAQCTGVFPNSTVCGNFSGVPAPPGPANFSSQSLLNSICTTPGAFPVNETSPISGWQCSTGGLTSASGIVFGASALNTSQNAIIFHNFFFPDFSTSAPMVAPFDFRWTWNTAAPAGQKVIGPNFYLNAEPSTDLDNHQASFGAVNGTVYSETGGTISEMIGGNFSAVRRNVGNPGGNSGNPVLGVQGIAFMGVTGDAGAVNGDGVYGGAFAVYPQQYAAGNVYDPGLLTGQVGAMGKSVVFGSSAADLAALDNVGVGGYVEVEGNTINAYGLHSLVNSRNNSMALAFNAYGLYVAPVSGALNINAAIRTSSGTVMFGGNEALVGNLIGGTTVTPLGPKPVINKVKGGANMAFSELTNSYNTSGTKNYTYQIVANFKTGINSAASVAVSNTVGFLGFDDLSVAGHNNYIQWTAVEGAQSYSIYRTAAGGTITNTTGLIATVSLDNVCNLFNGGCLAQTPPSYSDQGAAGDASSPPGPSPAALQVDGATLVDGGAGPGMGVLRAGSLSATGNLTLGAGGGTQWQIGGGNGNLVALVDNNVDIGTSGANRPRNIFTSGAILSASPTSSIGYTTGAGGTVTQLVSRASPVTINKTSGQITLLSAAGQTTATTFTVNNTSVTPTDTVIVNQHSGTNLYETFVTQTTANAFNITFFTTGTTSIDAPVLNFNVIKGSAN